MNCCHTSPKFIFKFNPKNILMYTEAFREMLQDSSRFVADMAVRAIEDDPEKFQSVLNLCLLEKYPISMRAARVIELYSNNKPGFLDPKLEVIIPTLLSTRIGGVKRSFLKILSENVDLSGIAEPGPLLNQCFDWLMSPAEKPAIRVYSLEIIYKFSLLEPPLKHELLALLEMILPESREPSILGRGKKIMRKLKS